MTPAHLRVRTEAERLLKDSPVAIVADCQLGPEVKEWLPKPPVIIGVATQAGSLVLEVDASEYDGLGLARWMIAQGGQAPLTEPCG